jgi:MFS transporter, DHA3 family, macrolide efflux protein
MGHPYLELLRIREVRVLWAGHALSALGSELYRVGVIWLAVDLAGAKGSLLVTAQSATILVMSLSAGAFVELLPRRAFLIVSDLLAAALGLGLVVVAARSELTLGLLIGATMVLAGIGAAAYPVFQASLPRLAPPERLREVSGLFDATVRAASAIGPFLAAAALTLLPAIHLLTLNAASFLATAMAVALVGRKLENPLTGEPRPKVRVLSRLVRGAAAAKACPGGVFILAATAVRAGAYALGFTIAVPLLFSQESGAGGLGLVAVIFGAGALGEILSSIGAVTRRPRRPFRRLFEGYLMIGASLLALGFATGLSGPAQVAGLALAAAVMGVGFTFCGLQLMSWFGERLSTDDFAAVLRLRLAVSIGGMMAASAAGPLILPALGPGGAMLMCGAAVLGAGVLGVLSKQAAAEDELVA